MALNGWTDADPTVLDVLEAEEPNWTTSAADEAEVGLDSDEAQLIKNALNAAWAEDYTAAALPTSPWGDDGGGGAAAASGGILNITTTSNTRSFSTSAQISTGGGVLRGRVRINSGSATYVEILRINGSTTSRGIGQLQASVSGNDITFRFVQDTATTYTVTGGKGLVLDLWIEVIGATATKLYINGTLRLSVTYTAVGGGDQMIMGVLTGTETWNIDFFGVQYYLSTAAPAYSTTARTATTPTISDTDITTEGVSDWGTATFTAGTAVGNGGTARVRATDGTTTTSWTTITGAADTLDVSSLDPTKSVKFDLEYTSTDGTGAPRPITKISLDYSSDVTPPTNPTISAASAGGAVGGVMAEWVEGTDAGAGMGHHEIGVSFDGAATWLDLNDKTALVATDPDNTAFLKFLDGEAAQEAAGWRNARRLAIAHDAARVDLVVGSTVTFRVRSVDAVGNKSGWVVSGTATVGGGGLLSFATDSGGY